MSRIHPSLFLVGSLVAITACAPLPEGGGSASRTPRVCFNPDQIINFRQGDSQSIFVRARTSEVFEIRAYGYCPDLETANSIRISGVSGVPSRLCTGDTANVVPSASISSSVGCSARVDRRLTEAEIAALPDRQRP